ncbi:MAG: hypothetical protein GX130_08880 [Candidatus Hydrogenedens sp.]|jgi:hypothetical protein|nr:hypothetical protein [Candidatus Hydrogenedens sp.]
MNKKILIGFAVFLVIFLVLPLVLSVARGANGSETSARPTGPAEPPKWNAENLVGTAWSVKTPDIPVAVTINLGPGGQASATAPAMLAPIVKAHLGTDTIMGTWRVEGAKLIASVDLKGKTTTVACDILGDRIFYQDKEIKRVG